MECPYCGSELKQIDTWGKTKYADHYYLYPRSWIEREGDIYQCQNCYGFNTEEEAIEFANENNIKINNWQEVVCDSNVFNGYFYTDSRDELHTGYPC